MLWRLHRKDPSLRPTFRALQARITVRDFVGRLLALQKALEYEPEVVRVEDSLVCEELRGPVQDLVLASHSASKEMKRLSHHLAGCRHPLAASIGLHLEDLRMALKKARHDAMVCLSKLIVPDDLKVYVADFSEVLPSYLRPKQRTCTTTRDPLERAFGKREPSSIAQQVTDLSAACIRASTQFRLVLDEIQLSRDMPSFEA